MEGAESGGEASFETGQEAMHTFSVPGMGGGYFSIGEFQLLHLSYRGPILSLAERMGKGDFAEQHFDEIFTHIYDRLHPKKKRIKAARQAKPDAPVVWTDAVTFADMCFEIILRIVLGKVTEPIRQQELNRITELDLSCPMLSDIEDLKYIPNIRVLDVSFTGIEDTNPIEQLKHLDTLLLSKSDIPYPPSAPLRVKELYMSYCSDLQLEHIGLQTQLELLDVSGNDLTDLGPIVQLTALTDLIIYNNSLTRLDGIGHLQQLKRLDISLNPITNISELAQLPDLAYINLNWTRVEDYSPLLQMNTLRFVDVSYVSDSVLQRYESLWQELEGKGVTVKKIPD